MNTTQKKKLQQQSNQHIVIIGAGLSGSMMAVMMAQRGYMVDLYERRSDPRKNDTKKESTSIMSVFGTANNSSKRSINLALSYRGQMALKKIGLHEKVMEFAIPMMERSIHLSSTKVVSQPYGTKDQKIYSVSRTDLNNLLLNEAESHGQVKIHFNHILRSLDKNGKMTFETDKKSKKELSASIIIGADGVFSVVRSAMSRLSRQNFSQQFIPHGYKELTIPPSVDGDFALKPINALHIWPRKEFMMIALPNPNKTFTCTLFAPYKGEGGFESLDKKEKVQVYFEKNFPDVLHLLPNLLTEFFENPTGSLATISVFPWHVENKILLIGDAAHAIVPFYGQGMNAAFEDCLFFQEILDQHQDNLKTAVEAFCKERKPQTDALAQLSLSNYIEMRSHTASVLFRIKKKVEGVLHSIFPNQWIPLYTMISFSRIPYDQALEKAKRQDKMLFMASSSALVVVTCTFLYHLLNRNGKS